MGCPKHGPVAPCDGAGRHQAGSWKHQAGLPGCDPTVPHCPTCGRTLRP